MYISPIAALQLTPVAVRRRALAGKATVTTLLDTQDKALMPNQKGGKGKCRAIFLRISLKNELSSHRYHSAQIRIYGSSKDPKQYLMRPDSRLWVHCRCPFFLYYCEQALTRIKASSLYDCQPSLRVSDRSRQRNPDLVPYLCKHLYAAILAIMREERGRTTFKQFKNKYKGDYSKKIPPSYTK